MKREQSWNMGTLSVWGGEKQAANGEPTQVPVVHSVSFGYQDVDEWLKAALGLREGHIYSRNTNPTVEILEEKIRILEGAEKATSFSTGMGAISGLLFGLLTKGQRVVSIRDTYGGTSKIFMEFFPKAGLEAVLCPTTDFERIEEEIEKGCDLLYLETPTNPTMKIVDIKRLSEKAKAKGAIVACDNTFATPINQNPLLLGADLVVHSATKYLGGHADALGGLVCGKKELIDKIFHYKEITGSTLHPMSAYLILRGMKTLELRVKRQNENAMAIAKFLEKHPKVEKVFYPGLESHEGYEIAKRQMKGYGGMLSFTLIGDSFETVKRFLPKLKLAHKAANLGAVETIAGVPATTSHVECTAEERKSLGIPETLIRYSVGIENSEDLIADLDSALKEV